MTHLVEFVIPLDPLKLEDEGGGTDRFHVQMVHNFVQYSQNDISGIIDDIESEMRDKQAYQIIKNDVFDQIYSLIKAVSSFEVFLQNRLTDMLANGLESLMFSINNILCSEEDDAFQDEMNKAIKVHKNALKMYMFCIHWLFALFEKDQQQQQQATRGRGRRGNNTRSRRRAAMIDSEWKERIMKVIISVIEQAELGKLWHARHPEERFMNLFFGIAFTLTENSDNMKQKAIKDYTFHLVNAALNSSEDHSNAVTSVINLIMRQEQSISHIVDMFKFVFHENRQSAENSRNNGNTNSNNIGGSAFVNEVFTEIGKLEDTDFHNDSAGARNLAAFIMSISDELPQSILANISIIIQHLNNESYNVRNAILHALSRAIHKILVQGGRDDDDTKKTRDQLLDIMQERFRDINAFTRGKNIQCWTYLCENKSIPMKRLETIVELVIQRMTDKGAYVRRAAVQFMVSLIKGNPYAATLRKTTFLRQLEGIDKKLQELQGPEDRVASSDHDVDNESTQSTSGQGAALENNVLLSEGPSNAQHSAPNREMVDLLKFKAYVVGALNAIKLIEDGIRVAGLLLQSKTSQDVIECINLFVIAHAAEIEAADEGIKRMLRLVWSREQSVRDAVVNAFSESYLFGTRMESPKTCCEVVTKITRLVKSCTISELRALEAIIIKSTRESDNNNNNQEVEVIVRTLWSIYKLQDELVEISEISPEDSEAAAIVLAMVAKSRPELVRKKYKTMLNIGLGQRGSDNVLLAKYTCEILETIAGGVGSLLPTQQQLDDGTMSLKFRPDSAVIRRLGELICSANLSMNHWIVIAGPAMDSIFALCNDPLSVSEKIIKYFASRLSVPTSSNRSELQQEGDEGGERMIDKDSEESQAVVDEERKDSTQSVSISTNSLAKLLFVLGHCSFRHLVLVEAQYKEAKRRRQVAVDGTMMTQSSNDEKKKKKRKKRTKKTVSGKKSKKVVVMEGSEEDSEGNTEQQQRQQQEEEEEEQMDQTAQELGMDASTVDEHEIDEEFEQRERDIFAEDTIYHTYATLVLQVCTDQEQKFTDTMLKKCAVLALCKFMIVSQDFCEKNLRILFSLLETSMTQHAESNSIIKSNIIISVGDMACRFPNTVEPWMQRLYSCLYDRDVRVRKHALMVLTHLVLNDMTKMKSRVADIVRCIEDDDDEIRTLTKSFFSELACKSSGNNNPIYNLLPEILSRLADDKNLSEESFRTIMQYLLGFITKDRHTEKLVEKLCQRFSAIDKDVALWQDIAFCLSMLQINDKCFKRIVDGFKFYQHALVDDEVYDIFVQIGSKIAKKGSTSKSSNASNVTGAALDAKQALEEWQAKLEETHNKLKEDRFTVEKLVRRRKQGRSKRRVFGLVNVEIEEQEEEEEEEGEVSGTTEDHESESRAQPTVRATPSRARNRGRGAAKSVTRRNARGRASAKKVTHFESSSESDSDVALDSESDGHRDANNENDVEYTPRVSTRRRAIASKNDMEKRSKTPLRAARALRNRRAYIDDESSSDDVDE